MNNSEKELFRRALSYGGPQPLMTDELKERIARSIARKESRRRQRSNILSAVAAVAAMAAIPAAFLYFMPASWWGETAGLSADVWNEIRYSFSEIARGIQILFSDRHYITLYIYIMLMIVVYNLLARWLDMRRAARNDMHE